MDAKAGKGLRVNDENDPINQDEVERLLQGGGPQGSPPDKAAENPPPGSTSSGDSLDQSAVEAMMSLAGQEGSAQSAPATQSPHVSNPPDPSKTDGPLSQDNIDQLLSQTQGASTPDQKPPTPQDRASDGSLPAEEAVAQGDVEYLLDQAERALQSLDRDSDASHRPGLATFQFEEFRGAPASTETATLDLLSDVQLDLKIELGRTHMYLEDVLKLRKGSVVPLDKLAGDPVDIYVNERLIARGEVLVLNDNFCVRVGELIAGSKVNG